MSVKNVDPDTKPQFNYLVCLDIVVLACILVVAGRPDGLAITLSAIIVAIAAVFYRCSVSVTSSMSGKSQATRAGLRNDVRKLKPAVEDAPVDNVADGNVGRKSWLREAE